MTAKFVELPSRTKAGVLATVDVIVVAVLTTNVELIAVARFTTAVDPPCRVLLSIDIDTLESETMLMTQVPEVVIDDAEIVSPSDETPVYTWTIANVADVMVVLVKATELGDAPAAMVLCTQNACCPNVSCEVATVKEIPAPILEATKSDFPVMVLLPMEMAGALVVRERNRRT